VGEVGGDGRIIRLIVFSEPAPPEAIARR